MEYRRVQAAPCVSGSEEDHIDGKRHELLRSFCQTLGQPNVLCPTMTAFVMTTATADPIKPIDMLSLRFVGQPDPQ